MPSLPELQRAFGEALLSGTSTALDPHVSPNGLDAAARLRIYRNNAREGFLTALRAQYPVLARLVGEDYFRQLAQEYRERHPSPSGNLHHVGAALPQYLAARFAGGEYDYFADVARLEWAVQDAFVAADHAPLDRGRLAQIDPARYADLSFALHPAARLVFSAYPVLTIWRANQVGADAQQRIDLDAGAEQVLVTRTAEDVELAQIDACEFAFLSQCAAGASFADAVASASEVGAFDAGSSLRRHVADGTLVDFHFRSGETE